MVSICGPQYNNDLSSCKHYLNGTFSKRFPKCLNSSTVVGDGSFPCYRRRGPAEGGRVWKKCVRLLNSKVTVNNRNVVAYSSYSWNSSNDIYMWSNAHQLLQSNIRFYHFKGEDLVTQELDIFLNEISAFQAQKNISSCYAPWRAAEIDMLRWNPTVHQLPVRLLGKQSVTYDVNEKMQKQC